MIVSFETVSDDLKKKTFYLMKMGEPHTNHKKKNETLLFEFKKICIK